LNAFDRFGVLVSQLAQHWGVAADAPNYECASRFTTESGGEIMLRLSGDEAVIVVGASLPLSRLCDGPVQREALQQFLLQQTHAARLGSEIRYAWLQEEDRIALYRGIETRDATIEELLSTIDGLNAGLDALAQTMPVFRQSDRPAPPPDDGSFLNPV
jgi:hypothetical protein